MVQSIVFDIAGVIAQWDPKGWSIRQFGEELGPKVLAAAMWDSRWGEQVDRGTMSEEEFFRLRREERPELAKELTATETGWREILQPKQDTEDLIRRLKKGGHRIYYLSNFPERTIRKLLETVPAFGLMDGGVVSYDVHQVKPNPDIYQTLLNRYQLEAKDTVFTDDTSINVEGAQKVGIHAWHFTGAAGFEGYLREELGLVF